MHRWCVHPFTGTITFLPFQALVEDTIPELKSWRGKVLPQSMTCTLRDFERMGDAMVSAVNLPGMAWRVSYTALH